MKGKESFCGYYHEVYLRRSNASSLGSLDFRLEHLMVEGSPLQLGK